MDIQTLEWNNRPYIDKKGISSAISQGLNNYDCVINYTLNFDSWV